MLKGIRIAISVSIIMCEMRMPLCAYFERRAWRMFRRGV